MDPNTKTFLQRFEEVNWFSSVGIQGENSTCDIQSWNEAVFSIANIDWEESQIDMANALRMRVTSRSVRDYDKYWNKFAKRGQKPVIQLLNEKIRPYMKQNDLPESVFNSVYWDFIHLYIECEYSYLVEPELFHSHVEWYAKGHFPCGRVSEYPDGRLIVF